MLIASMLPDESALRRDLAAGRFLTGEVSRRWRLCSVSWPYVVIAVQARDGSEVGLRFECTDYPATPVTAQPWNIAADIPLDRGQWPGGTSRIPLAFNPDWKNGSCLYLPCDRQSIEGHDQWRHQHPALLWDPAIGITKYLGIVHELLISSEYGGRLAVPA